MDAIKTVWWLVLGPVCLQSIAAGYDPCRDATELNSIHRRLSGYTLGASDSPLCDRYLAIGWYSVLNLFIATSPPSSCGTVYIWWMNDTKPSEVGTVFSKRVCLKTSSSDCEYTDTVQMINCGNRFVYQLRPTQGCPEAFCLDMEGPKPTGDISAPSVSLYPHIEVERQIERVDNILHFYCKFVPDGDTTLWYTVEWYRGDKTLGIMLFESNPTQFITWDEFKLKTALKEGKMGRIGIYLVCSVNARRQEFGFPSEAFSSKPFFAGFEILNNTVIYLNGLDNPQVFIRSTIPFACNKFDPNCAMHVAVLMPNTEKHCKLPDIGTTESSKCGVKIFKNNWDKPVPLNIVLKPPESSQNIKVTSMEIHLRTLSRNRDHPIFENHVLPQSVKVQISTNMDVLKGKMCYAVCDPHMQTFDGVCYENHQEGTFVMYKNTEFQAEVQIRTKACYGNNKSPFCPCGVAVRAGGDVFIMNLCDTSPEISMRRCSDGVLNGKVKEDGTSYKVFLPTGSEVTIERSMEISFNVYIRPSLLDYKRTTGLCGFFDGTKAGDLLKRNNNPYTPAISHSLEDPVAFNNEWRVISSEDLFKVTSHSNLPPWKKEIYVCTCPESNYNDNIDTATCEPERQTTCERNNQISAEAGKCGLFRKRRTTDKEERYNTLEVDPQEIHKSPIKISKRSYSSRTMYSESDARVDCENYLNSSLVFQKCSHLPDLDPKTFIETCVMDAMITNSMDWAGSNLESAKTICISQVQLNRPIPKDVLERFENSTRPANSSKTTNNYTEEVSTGPPLDDDNVYSDTLLNELESLSCPMDCDGHGVCKNGSCECFQGYGDLDCSVDLNKPPTVIGIPDLGLCDLQQRPCEKTAVLGLNFIDIQTLSCRLTDFKVRQNGTEQTDNTNTLAAKRISNVEIECSLPEKRDARKSESAADDSSYLARGYRVSVSNNGELFSHESTLLIYDSACINCSKAGFDIQCMLQDGFCLMDGNCYRVSESRGCLTCEMTHDTLFSWVNGPEQKYVVKVRIVEITVDDVIRLQIVKTVAGPGNRFFAVFDCPESKTAVTVEASELWIIGAVLGPVGLISLIVAVTLSIKKCTRTKRVTASQEWTDSVMKSSAR